MKQNDMCDKGIVGMENRKKEIYLRKYEERDCIEMAELFYETVHTITVKDYSEEQRKVWATGYVDFGAWNTSFLSHYTLIATYNKQIVGFADLDDTGYLDRLYVHKNYQRIGIATMLCDALEEYAKRNRNTKVTTHASITARPFFMKRGYEVKKEQKVIRDGISLTNYVMEIIFDK